MMLGPRQVWMLPVEEAIVRLGTSKYKLKQVCLQHGIARWPHRKIKSLQELLLELELQDSPDSTTSLRVHAHLQHMLLDPRIPLDPSIQQLLRVHAKRRFNLRAAEAKGQQAAGWDEGRWATDGDLGQPDGDG